MAQNAGYLSAQVAERVRDPNFNATTQAQTINLLSYGQQVVNGILWDVTGSASLVLQPRTLIYSVSGFLPSAVRILAIQDASGRNLVPIGPHESLTWANPRWVTAVSDAPRGWAMFGRDVLVIYPGVRSQQTLTVTYATLTAALATTADSTVVPNEDDDAVMDLAEILLLMKNRDMGPCQNAMERFAARIKLLKDEPR